MPKLYDLARMTTATVGTGTITLGAAVSGYLTFAQAGAANLDIIDYAISDGANSEIGVGTYTSSGTTLTRNVTKSTNSNSAISLSGSAQVFITPRAETLVLPMNHLSGLVLSTAGSSATFGIAAGQATDSTNLDSMTLASAYTKTTSAWAVGTGNGSLDTGSIAASTWYHAYLIKRLDTGVVDVLCSLSASAPTMPSSYTLFRRIGSMKTNGSSQWTGFLQTGDNFSWMAGPVIDINVTNPGTAAVLRTLSTPLGVKVEAIFDATILNAAGVANGNTYFSDPDTTDYAPVGSDVLGATNNNSVNIGIRVSTITNTSSQIRTRAIASGGGSGLSIATRGWIDTRGKLG